MAKWTVTKEMKWECAHRLVKGYPDKCAHVHGHSWLAFVEVGIVKPDLPEGLKQDDLDQYDFVQDFSCFKELRRWIDETWDHATLVCSQDTELLAWLQANNQRHYIFVDENPTSEIIAKFLFEKAEEIAVNRPGLKVLSVRVKETCTSEAYYGL